MAKKNFVRRSLTLNINKAIGFTWPVYHEGKTCYVDFYAYDPARDAMVRCKHHLDSIKTKKARQEAAKLLIHKLSSQLSQGWNPFLENGKNGLATIDFIFDKYEQSLTQYTRKKTEQSYRSRLTILKKYISELPIPPKYAYQLDTVFFIEFLDWLIYDREVNARTRNNYKGWLTSFCEWMVLRKYHDTNPAQKIPKLKEDGKLRRALSHEELKKLFNFLKAHDKPFLLACLFEYYTFIRPTELSHLKVEDIDIKNQCVYISESYSKNRRDGSVSLNKQLILLMVELGTFNYPGNYYLFSDKFKPGKERVGGDHFNKRFAKLRKGLKFGSDLKFYSLKDSGIADLSNSKGVVVARDQARHTDISTTNKYLQGRDLKGPDAAKDFTGAYSD